MANTYALRALHTAINAVVPIVGVDADLTADKSTWAVWLADGSRARAVDVANAVVTAFNPATQAPAVTLQADSNYADLVSKLTNATPAQIQTYVNNNVTDLPSAKVLLAKILLLLAVSFNQ